MPHFFTSVGLKHMHTQIRLSILASNSKVHDKKKLGILLSFYFLNQNISVLGIRNLVHQESEKQKDSFKSLEM